MSKPAPHQKDQGLLISFDGIDSSGKQTQACLLKEALQSSGHEVINIATPDYSTGSGRRLKRLFQGLDGGWDNLKWREQMRLIADNRAEHRPEVVATLATGGIVIYDRYVPSSIVHMTVSAARAGEKKAREIAPREVSDYEYGTNLMPHENLSIFLDVPPPSAHQLLNSRKRILGETDEQTDDLALQEEIYQEYGNLVSREPERILRIICTAGPELFPPEKIHRQIWTEVNTRFPLLTQ